MSRSNFSGPIVVGGVQTVTTTDVLASGAVTIDLSADLSVITGAVISREGSGGAAALEYTISGTDLIVDDGSGSTSDNISVIAFGTPA